MSTTDAPSKCKLCRKKDAVEKHYPFCSFECWQIRESEVPLGKKKYRDKLHHRNFQKALASRVHLDQDEHRGLILQMITKAEERGVRAFRYRCHSCGIGIRDESQMINEDGWLYCGSECLQLALTDEQARKNRADTPILDEPTE